MKIHSLKLENVRNIRRVHLDLSAPCTVVVGRTGTCKSTTQQAALAALFRTNKKDREALVSKFDQDAMPKAVLELSRGQEGPTIKLSRSLLDEAGEWCEGGTTVRGKGKAFDKVQELLPISAAAAAALLWGKQERLCDILGEFPVDGHSLLTAATVRGTGPDPKCVVEELERAFKASKRTGNSPGALTRFTERVASLEAELDASRQAEQGLRQLREKYGECSAEQKRLSAARQVSQTAARRSSDSQKSLKTALKLNKELAELQRVQADCSQLDDRIAKATRTRNTFADELKVLQAQCRVARDGELAAEIGQLTSQISLVQDAHKKVQQAQDQIDAKQRPGSQDVDRLRKIIGEIRDATSRLDANGLRYRVSVENGKQIVAVTEDAGTAASVEVTPEKPHESVVGRVVIHADQLRFAASGKEDVASLKRSIERAQQEKQQLLGQFVVTDEHAFDLLAKEQVHLESELTDRKNERVVVLKGKTLDELQAKLKQLQQTRDANRMTNDDQVLVGGRFLPGSAEIEKRMLRKEAELDAADATISELGRERLTEAEQRTMETRIDELRRRASAAETDFRGRDEHGRESSEVLLVELDEQVTVEQSEFDSLTERLRTVEKELAGLAGDIKHAGPERPTSSVQADLDEARELLRREETWQEARQLLISRIQEKMTEMAVEVPAELGARISQHLGELSAGVFGGVKLNDNLSVRSIQQDGEYPVVWTVDELCAGERTLAALTLRIAVALSLAEIAGPIFVMLDDSLVNLDPEYRAATEHLLSQLVADGRLQIILFTCHTDWARGWEEMATDEIRFIDLPSNCEYFQTPAAFAVNRIAEGDAQPSLQS